MQLGPVGRAAVNRWPPTFIDVEPFRRSRVSRAPDVGEGGRLRELWPSSEVLDGPTGQGETTIQVF